MSLKRERKSRSGISRFLAALLRPFMSEPPPPQLPYLFFHSPDARHTENVADWNSYLSQHLDDDDDNCYAKCSLRYIEYCKCSQGVEHEFLVFHFGHWISGSSAIGVVCADRTVSIHSDNSSSSSAQSSGLVSPSSTDNIAHDTVTIIGSPHDATRYLTKTYGSFRTLCKLQFSPPSRPSALQVSVVLALVNGHSHIYHIYERQCYWFADTVWKSLKRLFPENEELCTMHNIRCRRGPFQFGPSEESVDAVCENYKPAWSNTLEQMGQARRCRAARQEQLREVVRAERQREIEEIQARAQQREREMEAQVQQREHELEEMRAERQREAEMMRVMQAEIQRLRTEQAGS